MFRRSSLGVLLTLLPIACGQSPTPIIIKPDQANSVLAKRGDELAQSAIESGNRDLATLYLLNAIQRDPSDPARLERYKSLVLEKAGSEGDTVELDRLLSILQAAVYQVPPDDILKVTGWIEEVQKKQTSALRPPEGISPDPMPDFAGELKRLSNATNEVLASPEKIAERIQAIAAAKSELIDSDSSSQIELLSSFEQQEARWNNIAQVTRILNQCQRALDAAQSADSTSNSAAALSALQAAEGLLPQLWALPLDQLPTELADSVRELPSRIAEHARNSAESQSKPYLDEIVRLQSESLLRSKDIDRLTTADAMQLVTREGPGAIQSNLVQMELRLQEAQRQAGRITGEKAMKEAMELLQAISGQIARGKRAQFNQYQRWTIAKCKQAFGTYKGHWWNGEADAVRIFEEHKLNEVDLTLLSPEVSQAFQDVLGKLFAEMYPAKIVDLQEKLGDVQKHPKIRLENF